MRTLTKVTLVRDPDKLPATFHMRRCQMCDALNIHPILVKSCENCHKPCAPFYYYEEGAVQVAAEQERPHYRPSVPTEYGPLIGVTILWSE
jgi:hypothetical protein